MIQQAFNQGLSLASLLATQTGPYKEAVEQRQLQRSAKSALERTEKAHEQAMKKYDEGDIEAAIGIENIAQKVGKSAAEETVKLATLKPTEENLEAARLVSEIGESSESIIANMKKALEAKKGPKMTVADIAAKFGVDAPTAAEYLAQKDLIEAQMNRNKGGKI